MGLDMYLEKKIYVGNNYKNANERLKIITPQNQNKNIEEDKITYIIQRAGYWRKASAIHRWFVENVQGGEDDCKEYYVEHKQMRTLLDLCQRVISNSKLVKGKVVNGYGFKDDKQIPNYKDGKIIKDPTVAKELLPVQEGFFFGNTDYNEWYLENIKATKEILIKALADEDGDYYYQSSW